MTYLSFLFVSQACKRQISLKIIFNVTYRIYSMRNAAKENPEKHQNMSAKSALGATAYYIFKCFDCNKIIYSRVSVRL